MTSVVCGDAHGIVTQYRDALKPALGKTFLVTGAGGMVGGYIVHALMALGEQHPDDPPTVIAGVRSVVRAWPWLGRYAGRAAFRWLETDVEHIDATRLGTVDYIVHAASPASPSAFRDHPLGVIGANVQGTQHLLELACTGKSRMCLVSSMEVYGGASETARGCSLAEHDFTDYDPLDVRSAYPVSKRMAENLCTCQRSEHGTDFVVARLGHTYGPGMKLTDERVQTQFMRGALRGEGITMRSAGKKQRAYTYMTDACNGILLALLHGESGEAYNIAKHDAVVSIRELAEIILREAGDGSGSLRVEINEDSGNMWSRVETPVTLDCRRIEALGWQPQIGVREGIARTLRFHRAAGAL